MKGSKTIMLQGTASGVGKSTLATGLCRIFSRKGLAAAPFKAQNLSGNAHTLPDGRLMARSQAIAAAACGLEAVPDMNPVLLRPWEGGCRFIVNGEAVGGPDRDICRKAAREAYGRLAEEYEVIVAEGAGSPVELNLRDGDIVNMDFALHAGCPVILVSDIARGGVFASLYGTISLLQPRERDLVKGIIVNGFMGDPSSFGEGRDLIEEICGVPVLGVVPHMDICLEDEDDLPGEETLTREKIEEMIPEGMSFGEFQQHQFDLLADKLEEYLDMDRIMDILEEGCI